MTRFRTLVVVGLAAILSAALAVPWPAEAARVLVFNSTRFVDFGQGPGYPEGSQESENVQASLTARGHTVTQIAGPHDPQGLCGEVNGTPVSQPGTVLATAAEYNTALANADVFLIPEQESWCYLPGELTFEHPEIPPVWRNWVNAGGALIIHSSNEARTKVDDLLFVVFGFRAGTATGTNVTTTRRPAAAGTAFATGPLTLPGNESSGMIPLSSLPSTGRSIYDNGTLASVVIFPFGAGKIIFLAWDWTISNPPFAGGLDGGWQNILAAAVTEATTDAATLTVQKAGAGSGTVHSTPAGIDCGATCSASFSGSVTLTATPAAGSTFAGWSGGCSGLGGCTVSPAGSPPAYPGVTATFSLDSVPSVRAEVGVYRRSTGQWLIRRATDGGLTEVAWGAPTLGDVPVEADYDGDGSLDIAVYRTATGEWLIRRSGDGGLTHLAWGAPVLDDVPAPVDYDGDGKADVAVYRRSTGLWLLRRSTDGGLTQLPWGAPSLGDLPVPADYDGDGRADVAIYRRATGEWYIRRSTDAGLMQLAWGSPFLDDVPAPGDYDGDGKADIAVYRRSTGQWLLRRSTDAGLTLLAWGAPVLADQPVPADYDGDGKTDIAVYRGNTGEWLIRRSTDAGLTQLAWGAPPLGDLPLHRPPPLR
jgi:hypothetical protein